MRFYLFLLSILIPIGCNSGRQQGANTAQAPVREQAAPQPAGVDYPGLPVEKAVEMYNECDYIDVIFYDMPISLSQNERASIQNTIGYISDSPATLFPDCKSVGRFFFQKEGDDMIQADFYFGGKCYAFVFLENGKPKYGNKLTDQGKAYFEKIFNSY